MGTTDQAHRLLIVDDEESILNSLKRLFRKDGYHIQTALSGQAGIEVLNNSEKPYSLIISDQRMPGMNGAQFLEEAKKIFPDAIRFLLTGYSDMDAIVDAVNKGEIHRYLVKPWDDGDLRLQVQQSLKQYELVLENRRLLELTGKQNEDLNDLNRNLEGLVEKRTLEIEQKHRELQGANQRLEKSFMGTIRLLASLVETINPVLGKYMGHVAELSREIAKECKLDKEAIDQVEMAGMIHDIGLMGLHENIFSKDMDSMSAVELEMFAQHPAIASISLEGVERLNRVGEIILSHHECYDGSGFPGSLKGDKIPLESRIIGTVGGYCQVLHGWPKGMNQIIEKARRQLGSKVVKNMIIAEPEEMIKQIAKMIVLQGVHQKYDIEVVSKLMKKIEEYTNADKEKKSGGELILLIAIEMLKEGMVLEENLRVNDGRLLLVKGAELKKSTITTIHKLYEMKMIKNQIRVSV